MKFSMMELKSIAASGGGMIIDASRFPMMELKSIAASANGTGAKLTFRNVGQFQMMDLKSIAASGGGNVVFDFTE